MLPPTNDMYAEKCHTRMVYGSDQLVTVDPNRIIPIGYIRFRINC